MDKKPNHKVGTQNFCLNMKENEFPLVKKDHTWNYTERGKTCYKPKREGWELLAKIRTSNLFDSDATHVCSFR